MANRYSVLLEFLENSNSHLTMKIFLQHWSQKTDRYSRRLHQPVVIILPSPKTKIRGQSYKTFYDRKLHLLIISWSICLSSIVLCLQVRLKPTRVKCLSGAHLQGRLLALPTNSRLGWKGLTLSNALTYYEKASLMAVKSFITLANGAKVIKTFYSRS
jgi:hypothetical protein